MGYTTIKALADELGIDRSNMRKYVLKHGFAPVSIRTADSSNQATLALLDEDAEMIRVLRTKQGFSATLQKPLDNEHGFFYLIQLVPDLDPLRVKLGWTNDTLNRLSAHRTAAPTAELIKAWICRKAWEIAAIHSATRIDCALIGSEVYRCTDLDALTARCDAFFALMPGARGHE